MTESKLREAASGLAAEVRASIGHPRWETNLRAILGNTNYNCLMRREKALREALGEKEPKCGCGATRHICTKKFGCVYDTGHDGPCSCDSGKPPEPEKVRLCTTCGVGERSHWYPRQSMDCKVWHCGKCGNPMQFMDGICFGCNKGKDPGD